MRNRIALFALLIPSLAWAGNTCTTTATGSNWSSSSHWTCTPSGTVPGNGDIAVINNATTVDVNTTVGQSGPSMRSMNKDYQAPSLSQTSGGGSLPAGAYYVAFTNVDSSGVESAPAETNATQTLTSGYTLVVTLPALPAGVSSRKIYITNTAGGSLTEHLYATGVTGTTYNATSASWTNGTTTYAAATAIPKNWAIYLNANLTLATNVSLTMRGDMLQLTAAMILDCGSTFKFDSSASAGTTNNQYAVFLGNSYGSAPEWESSGSCFSNPWTITSNTGGGNGAIIQGIYAGGADGRAVTLALSNGTISNLGTSTFDGIEDLVADTNAAAPISVSNVIFSGDGEIAISGLPLATNFALSNNTWTGSLGTFNLWLNSSSGTATGTRTFSGNIFDIAPGLNMNDAWPNAATGNYFDQAWSLTYTPTAPMTGNLIRLPSPTYANGVTDNSTMTNNYFLTDYWPAATVTSTATSSTASTLVDTSQSWATNAYQSVSANGWEVLITGGTGVNQLRSILGNTSNTLTLSRNWATNPDSTSTYAIYNGIGNLHVLNAAGSSGGITNSGNIFELTGTMADGLGHCFLQGNVGSNTLTLSKNIALPDGSGLNLTGTLTIVGQTGSGGSEIISHNTAYVGNYTGLQTGDYTGAAGMVSLFKNNLFWVQSSVPSSTFGGSKAVDTGHPTSGGVQNYVAPANANYNACWNCQTMGYSDNGYGINLSSAAGGNDVNLSGSTTASGPNFVDSTRNFIKWCQSLGTTGTLRTTVIANCRASMMSVNNFSGAQTAYTPAALVTYVTAGFAPQNVALHNAASDGTDIGAVAYQALPSAALPVHSAVIF